MRLKPHWTILIVSVVCTSCATIFNGRSTQITVHTTAPSQIVYKEDTLRTVSNKVHLRVPRIRQPLEIVVISDTLRKLVTIRPNHSLVFFSNIIGNYGIGMAIDATNPKRFGYPQKVYVNPFDPTNDYSRYGEPNNKGELMIHLSVPYFNSFYLAPGERLRESKTGFGGFSAGVDYYYSKNKFVNFSAGFSTNVGPPPLGPLGLSNDREILTTYYLSFSNNYKMRRFCVGYGLTIGRNYWFRRLFNLLGLHDPNDASGAQRNGTYGLIFSGYYQVGQHFNFGMVYKPTFLRPDLNDPFEYEHVLSLDVALKIRVKK